MLFITTTEHNSTNNDTYVRTLTGDIMLLFLSSLAWAENAVDIEVVRHGQINTSEPIIGCKSSSTSEYAGCPVFLWRQIKYVTTFSKPWRYIDTHLSLSRKPYM